MTDNVIPASTKLAAKRGFIRTTAQAAAATLTTGVSASIVLGVVTGQVELVPTVVTLGIALVSPFIAGAASYLSILSNGIPEDYTDAAATTSKDEILANHAALTPTEKEADEQAALTRRQLRDQ